MEHRPDLGLPLALEPIDQPEQLAGAEVRRSGGAPSSAEEIGEQRLECFGLEKDHALADRIIPDTVGCYRREEPGYHFEGQGD